jgi:hypothetical protein
MKFMLSVNSLTRANVCPACPPSSALLRAATSFNPATVASLVANGTFACTTKLTSSLPAPLSTTSLVNQQTFGSSNNAVLIVDV